MGTPVLTGEQQPQGLSFSFNLNHVENTMSCKSQEFLIFSLFYCYFYFLIRLISRETDPVALGWERPAVCGREPCLFGSPLTQKVMNWTRASVWPDSLNWRAQAAKCRRMSYRNCSNLYKKTIFRKMNSSWGQLCPGWVSSCCSGCWWSFCSVCLVIQSYLRFV